MAPQLSELLREYFDRSAYGTIKALTEATRQYTTISESYVSHILSGRRQNPAEDKLVAIARALNLNAQETHRLLESAGIKLGPEIQRVVEALQRLSQTVGVSEQTIKGVVDGLVLMIEGMRASLVPAGPESERPLRRSGRPATLPPEVGWIDDLLGEILASDKQHPIEALFHSLEEATQEGWEVKRRLAEALPRLVQLQPEATLRLAGLLREDYHPDWRADIRRRVVEAVPALYAQRPQEALQLLSGREGDEVYTAMAAVEVLHDLESSGKMTAEAGEIYFQDLRLEAPDQQAAVDFLRRLLRAVESDPDAALVEMETNRAHPERIIRICIQRIVPRLLEPRPEPALELIGYFVRRDESGQPAEHQNLRRPVSKALPEIFELLARRPDLEQRVGLLLQALSEDPDIHVRRALSDALDRLGLMSANLTVAVLDRLIEDRDPYVRQRAWRVLLQLADLYPEQAAGYYARILT